MSSCLRHTKTSLVIFSMSKLKKCLYLIDLLSRRGSMSLKEINEHYAYSSIYDGEIIPRTFARYKEFIETNFPCSIEYNAKTREYYLKHDHLYGEDEALYEYLLSAYHIEGMSELAIKHRDKVRLLQAPTGVENVQKVLEAIDKGKGLLCDYYSFNKETKKKQRLIPYFLKTWEQRWYLVAEPDNRHHGLSVFALERMDNIQLTADKVKPSNDVTVDEYFAGSFGVNHSDEQKAERLVVKVYGTQADYVRALPIHESQREIEATKEYTIFEYHIVPCYNLYQQLLWHRERLEVLEPLSMREEMKRIVKKMGEMYE